MQPVTNSERLQQLVSRHQPGRSLEADFYRDATVYQADLERVWRRGWLFAGHSCEIPDPGDYFTVAVDADSIVILRDDAGTVHALHNVCRHRGSIVCTEPAGHLTRLVCPYHQWTYGLDGRLLACRGMQSDLDKATLGLVRAHAREVAGMIFVSLAPEPVTFEPAAELFESMARAQGLGQARVAKAIDYQVAANWKLVWENNRECFHCNANHPQYIKANFDHYNADDLSPALQRTVSAAVERSEKKWAAAGLDVTHRQSGMVLFPDAERNIWYSASRTPLADGYLTESMDGKPVAPLMGKYRDADVGTLRMRALPNFWNHSSCDHAVSTRLLPAGPELTLIRVYWLVPAEAVEGHDYDLARLLPFWQLTSEQDWAICENQQRGVKSSAYQPGPYSTYKEYNVENFVRWYLKQLRK